MYEQSRWPVVLRPEMPRQLSALLLLQSLWAAPLPCAQRSIIGVSPPNIHALTAPKRKGKNPSRKKGLSGRALDKEIQTLISHSPAVARGHFGFEFMDVNTGRLLAAQNAASFFTPASNTKLYTTALALVRLGVDYRFHTQLRTTTPWKPSQGKPGQGTIGDLQMVGGGDPNLSGRTLPYQPDAPEGDPLTVVKQMADQLYGTGVREITGDVIGIDTRYPHEPYPDGWTVDDSLYTYGTPVSALAVGDSTVSVAIRPTLAGNLAELQIRPAVSHFVFLNQVQTDKSNGAHIHIARDPGSSELVLTGTIGEHAEAWHEDLAVDDPALFAAEALVSAVRERGITVRGSARAQSAGVADIGGTLLAEHVSAPLAQSLQVVNKVSQNLHAEMLLREVAKVQTGVGSLAAGIAERERFLSEAKVTKEGTGFVLEDGSGLARQNLTAPLSTVTLLRYMWLRPEREVWLQSFPVGGRDGSLQHRYHGVAGAERIHGKTGSLAHVNALSGYIEAEHGVLAFSVMVNATSAREAEVRDFIDQLCALFLPL